MGYTDICAGAIFLLSIPWIIIKYCVSLPLALLLVVFSNLRWHTLALATFHVLSIMDSINILEKYLWVYVVSNVLYWPGVHRYQRNIKVIDFLRQKVKHGKVKYGELPSIVVNTVNKQGALTTVLKMALMYSVLPTVRHVFLNNPFLFEYKLYLKNEVSRPFADVRLMCELIYSYIGNAEFLFTKTADHRLSGTGFSASYYNDATDRVKNYDNIGFQIIKAFTTFIYLETVYKGPTELLNAITVKKASQTIMNVEHNPIYKELKDKHIELKYDVPVSNENRYNFLDLVVPYDSLYHFLSGKVEVNIVGGDRIEHPMLCLYHEGVVMRLLFVLENALFTTGVLDYLNNLERRA